MRCSPPPERDRRCDFGGSSPRVIGRESIMRNIRSFIYLSIHSCSVLLEAHDDLHVIYYDIIIVITHPSLSRPQIIGRTVCTMIRLTSLVLRLGPKIMSLSTG